MYYSIRHQTKYRYAHPVAETVMELRMQPRTEWTQHCLSFDVQLSPRARMHSYRDHLGNTVHHFNSPGKTDHLSITATSLVEVQPFKEWPEELPESAWEQIDAMVLNGDYHEMLQPSDFAKPSPLLTELAAKLHVTRRNDPMTVLRQITRGIHEVFQYAPKTTRVDSPIDDALRTRKGVCQDFSHIMITLVRQLKVPCRYVSGYVVRGEHQATSGGSHAWVEALMPGWGWVGFDPTINSLAGERHVRCAVGRDYADVPPTKGIHKGDTRGELSVQVQVIPTEAPSLSEVPDFAVPNSEEWLSMPGEAAKPGPSMAGYRAAAQQQQQ